MFEVETMSSKTPVLTTEEAEESISKFVELVKFETVSNTGTEGSYRECGHWLVSELKRIGLESFILRESLDTKPVVIATWLGSEPELPTILLNSHYDVVPVVIENWTVPAFQGLRRDNKIYGRGTQDMKCVCMQYITAIDKLIKSEYKPKRTVHLSFVPDEEIGGVDGMNVLLASDWFASISLELALDEGLASENDNISIFYGERIPWWIRVTASGNTGHASRFIESTAIEQILGVTGKALEFRKEQRDILHGVDAHAGCSHAVAGKKKTTIGDVTSLNVTMLRAGVRAGGEDVINVVPPSAEAAFDIRISPNMDPQVVVDKLDLWCEEVSKSTPGLRKEEGHGLRWEHIKSNDLGEHYITSTDPDVNKWYGIFSDTLLSQHGITLEPAIFPAATDSRFLRVLGYKALGFSPMRNTRIMLHENDEFIEEKTYLEGCEIFISVIRALSSQGAF